MRVLVADDDAVSRRILELHVERLGHECLLAADGSEAWDMFRRAEIDVIISDWVMPGIDGIELCRSIRKQPSSVYPYIILLTAREERQDFLAGMQAGADDYLTKPLDPEELQARLSVAARVTSLQRQLGEQKAELERLNRKLFEDGRRDSLTEIGNRRRMQEDLEQLRGRALRYGHSYCVGLCDIDHFKAYNDSCGHLAGDEVLRAVARTLARECRAGDVVYRFGGEEFLLILPEQPLLDAAAAVDRMRRAVKALAIAHPGRAGAGGGVPVITLSAGVAALAARTAKTIDEVLNEADVALYCAKRGGRDRVALHGPDGPELMAAPASGEG